jgi:alpha-mannosidase
MNRNSADRLTQAETLAAMLAPAAYRTEAYTEAWRNVLLYSEHTWGAAGSVTAPDSPGVVEQWEGKRKYAVNGETQSKALLAGTLQAYGTGTEGAVIDVHNSTSWPRSEVVLLAKEMAAGMDHVVNDRATSLPSQRLSTGELAVYVKDVPAFGSVRLHLSAKPSLHPERPVSVRDGVLDNGGLRVRVDLQTGNLVELTAAGKPANLIDTTGGEAANEYLYVQGKDFAAVYAAGKPRTLDGPDIGSVQKSGPVKIQVVENGPLLAMLRIESQAPGCNSLVREVRLTAGADWVELANTVDKKRTPLNTDPDRDIRGAYSQYGGKESVHFIFPFAVPGGKMHMDIPLGEMQPEVDQLPGSSKNWLPVSRWVDVAHESQGVTWVTLDAPLIEVGELSATLAGGQRNPALWRTKIAPAQKLYSWAMNNHWETNYKAYQEGVVTFRYAARAHGGYDPAAASRFATGLSQPLVVSRASAGKVRAPMLRIEPLDVLALALRPSDDGRAWMLQLFGASGQDRKARLSWPGAVASRVWVSDLSEKPITPIGDNIDVAGWDLVTLRVENKA